MKNSGARKTIITLRAEDLATNSKSPGTGEDQDGKKYFQVSHLNSNPFNIFFLYQTYRKGSFFSSEK